MSGAPFWRFNFVTAAILAASERSPFPAVMDRNERELMVAPVVRSARNQVLFREVNERIREVLDSEEGPLEFLCECVQEDCVGTILLSRLEYEGVRSGPKLFVVIPGHELLAVERVVHQTDRFVTVEKTVEAGFAVGNDPRSRDERG